MEKGSIGSIIDRIKNGESVLCEKCGKGHYKAVGQAKPAHYFVCDKCNNIIHYDPNITID